MVKKQIIKILLLGCLFLPLRNHHFRQPLANNFQSSEDINALSQLAVLFTNPPTSYLACHNDMAWMTTSSQANIALPLPHHLFRERLIALIDSTINHLHYSKYRLGGSYFNSSKGIYEIDCSEYVDHLLNNADPLGYHAIESMTRTARPTSEDYYAFFQHLPLAKDWHHWLEVKQVSALQAGDILVFRYKNLLNRHAAGHVMVVMNTPTLTNHSKSIYAVKVSDSAPSGHSNDTRQPHTSGIGIGTLLLRVDPTTQQPYAYAWKWGAPWENDVYFAMARPLNKNGNSE